MLDEALQPAKNIKASLEQVTVESVADFNGSINRLRQIALDAAKAVGYYETEVSFKHLGGDNIEVNLKAGEPVMYNINCLTFVAKGRKASSQSLIMMSLKNEALPQAGECSIMDNMKRANRRWTVFLKHMDFLMANG